MMFSPREFASAWAYTAGVLKHASTLLEALAASGQRSVVMIPDEGIALLEIERMALEQALMRTSGSVPATAALLQITPRMVRYKAQQHHLDLAVFGNDRVRAPRKVAA